MVIQHTLPLISAGGIGVVVLAYRPGPRLAITLDALLASTLLPREIIVVDNAGDDELTADVVASRPRVRLVRAPSNDGFGAGMNLGASKLQFDSEAILFLTHECKLDENAVTAMYAALTANSAVGAVGPVLGVLSQPDTIWSAGGSLTSTLRGPTHLRATLPLDEFLPDASVEWLDGAALLVRKDAFLQANGFSEEYFLYWEDIDFCHRLRTLGWTVLLSGLALGWQEPAMMSPYLDARNSLIFYRSSYPKRVCALAIVRQLLLIARSLRWPRESHPRAISLAWARTVGLAHGFSGRIDRAKAASR